MKVHGGARVRWRLALSWPPSSENAGGGGAVGGEKELTNRWRGVIRDAAIEGVFLDPMAFPVFANAGGGKDWEPFDWKLLKEAKQAVNQYGLGSPYTRAIVEHLFTANLLTPHDSKQISQMLLTPSQQLQFFSVWQNLCDQAAATPHPQGDPLYGVQTQMLMGTGPYVRTDWQANFAVEVLQLSQQLAHRALLGIREKKTPPAFTNVRQGPTEPYSGFVDRLHAAISAHPDLDETMKAKFLDLLTFDNANDKIKKS